MAILMAMGTVSSAPARHGKIGNKEKKWEYFHTWFKMSILHKSIVNDTQLVVVFLKKH